MMNEDPLAPARGIMWGLVLGLAFWALVALTLAIVYHQSVATSLAHEAIRQGIIP
jgi:hypothetical protein